MSRLHGLSLREQSYAILYARCVHRFPDIAQSLPKPDISQSYTFQNTAPLTNLPRQTWTDRAAPGSPVITPEESFFRTRPASCIICSQSNHLICECTLAQEYVQSKKATIVGNRLHLPNGQPIPSNITGHNLKERIDAWLAGPVAAAPTHPSDSNFTHDAPPHAAAHCIEIITTSPYGQLVPQAQIDEVTPAEQEKELDDEGDEDMDLFEVFATEQKKRNAKATQLPELTPTKVSEEPEEPNPSAAATSDSTCTTKHSSKHLPSNIKTISSQSKASNPIPTPPTFTNESLPSSTSRTPPQYQYQSNVEDLQLVSELFCWLLEGKLTSVTPAHILAASPGICKELVERLKTHKVNTVSFEEVFHSKPTYPSSIPKPLSSCSAEYSLPLREIDVLLNGIVPEAGILDQGSQIMVMCQDLAQEAGIHVNTSHQLNMEGANGLASKTMGCAENLTIQVGNVVFEVHAHIVEHAPFRLLLGWPFHHHLLCRLEDHSDRHVDISIRDPANPACTINIPSRARRAQVSFIKTFIFNTPSPPIFNGIKPQHSLSYQLDNPSMLQQILAYKKVARKVQPVLASLSEDYRIICKIPVDPLLSLPLLPTHPPNFMPSTRLTQECLTDLKLNRYDFLLPEELKLLTHVLRINELGLAWTEAEKGHFCDDYVSPIKIPVIEHVPWVQKNIPIPTGILDQVIQIFREKFAAGIYEHSDTSYRSCWFCVVKKNGSLRLVHDLQPLNAVTVCNSGVSPLADQLIEAMASCACYSMLDLFVGYDHHTLDVSSHDLTTIQSPISTLRLTCLPQGWTNAIAIFHEDVTFILEPEIPHVAWPFVDDCAIKGPASRFKTKEGGYEVIPKNDGIHKFIWQHLNDVHRILHRLSCAGATVSAKKLFIAVPEVVILGHKCNYEGRVPDDSKIARLCDWPSCKNISNVCGFLGLAGYMRIRIKNYSSIARPLVNLTRKGETFVWEAQHANAMQHLKDAIINSSALISIDYTTNRPVFLSVDSSFVV